MTTNRITEDVLEKYGYSPVTDRTEEEISKYVNEKYCSEFSTVKIKVYFTSGGALQLDLTADDKSEYTMFLLKWA